MPLRDQLGHFASDWLRNPITGHRTLLRTRRQGPRRPAAKQRDELAPYMAAIGKERELRPHWQQARELMLPKAIVEDQQR